MQTFRFTAFLFIFLNSLLCSNAQPKTYPNVIKNHFITQYPDEFFFIQCGMEDAAGNMWFGSAGDGIYFFDAAAAREGKKPFSNFTSNDGLCHNDILCCLHDKNGNNWFGTRNGFIRFTGKGYHPEKEQFSNYLVLQNRVDKQTRKKIPYSYQTADNFVWSIMEDKNGLIWMGTNRGIYIHNPQTDLEGNTPLFTSFLDDKKIMNEEKLQLRNIQCMLEDDAGYIWFVSPWSENGGEGICRYDPVASREGGHRLIRLKPDGIGSFRSIIKGRDGRLFFLSSYEGVYEYDPLAVSKGGKTFQNITRAIGITDTIITMLQDKAGHFFFGCNSSHMANGGAGCLWRYDPSARKTRMSPLTKFTTADGLSHNCVFCSVEDKEGNIWFGTRNTGLCRFNSKWKGKKRFTDFTSK